jgi:hypothetical protein
MTESPPLGHAGAASVPNPFEHRKPRNRPARITTARSTSDAALVSIAAFHAPTLKAHHEIQDEG